MRVLKWTLGIIGALLLAYVGMLAWTFFKDAQSSENKEGWWA